MKGRSLNKPLKKSEMERLPLGFTETSFGFTGQTIKRLGRTGEPHTNRRVTAGRRLQTISTLFTDGSVRTKQIWHRVAKNVQQ